MTAPPRAVVDLGSVSTSLVLVAEGERIRRSADTYMTRSSPSAPNRGGAKTLTDEGLSRVGDALERYRKLCRDRGAEVRAVATAAARDASNPSDLVALVADRLGAELEIIDPVTEGVLALIGASSDPALVGAEATRPVVSVDLGGSSTELAYRPGSGDDIVSWSMPLGGATVTSTYFDSDPPRPEELSAALSVIELHLDDFRRERPSVAAAIDEAVVVGLGGAVTVAAVEIGLLDVDPLNGDGDGPLHGFELTRDAVEDVFRTVATESRDDRRHNPGLPPSRVDDIVGGCAVLVETMRQLGLDRLLVSQRGLADGVLARWEQPAP